MAEPDGFLSRWFRTVILEYDLAATRAPETGTPGRLSRAPRQLSRPARGFDAIRTRLRSDLRSANHDFRHLSGGRPRDEPGRVPGDGARAPRPAAPGHHRAPRRASRPRASRRARGGRDAEDGSDALPRAHRMDWLHGARRARAALAGPPARRRGNRHPGLRCVRRGRIDPPGVRAVRSATGGTADAPDSGRP